MDGERFTVVSTLFTGLANLRFVAVLLAVVLLAVVLLVFVLLVVIFRQGNGLNPVGKGLLSLPRRV